MSKTHLLLAVTFALGVSSAALHAAESSSVLPTGENLQTLLETVRANRKALIAINLTLNKDEAAAFWPVYDKYQQEISAIGDKIVALIEDYTTHFADLSNEKALQIVNDYLDLEAERVKVRRTYVPEFAKVLPGRTVARFYQLENKMDAVLRFDLASTIPVIDQNAPGAPKSN